MTCFQGTAQKQRIGQLEDEVKHLRELQQGQDGVADNDENDDTIEGSHSATARIKSKTVAFHVTLDNDDHYPGNNVGQILVFKDVKLNTGGGYNNITGIFVTPSPGIYIFSLSVMTGHTHISVHVNLLLNGEEVAAAFASGESWDQGSVTTALNLHAGDEVHALVTRHDNVTVYGDKLTSFMGCLVTPF